MRYLVLLAVLLGGCGLHMEPTDTFAGRVNCHFDKWTGFWYCEPKTAEELSKQ